MSQCHSDANGLKTNAPMSFVWDIMRSRFSLDDLKGLKEGTPGYKILSKPPSSEISFKACEGSEIGSDVPRFLPNPEPNWGPKQRAVGKR